MQEYVVSEDEWLHRKAAAHEPATPSHKSAPHHRVHLAPEIVAPLQTLLLGFAEHAVDGTLDHRARFQAQLREIAGSFDEGSSSDDLRLAADRVVRLVDHYHDAVSNAFGEHLAELRAMLCSLTETMIFVSGFSETSVKQLTLLETRLQHMATLPEAHHLHSSMNDCLTLVRNESKRMQHESRAKVQSLKDEIDRLTHHLKAAHQGGEDAVTGLPGREAAEDAIEEQICNGGEVVAALFVMDQMTSINTRFGRKVGDQILLATAQTLAQKLSGVILYRWTGPAFLAVFNPGIHPKICDGRARSAATLRLEETFDIGDRSVMMMITCSLDLQHISAKFPPEAAFKHMEQFLAAHGAAPEQEP